MSQEDFKSSSERMRSHLQTDARLRHLDTDDLYLLSFLGDGWKLADSARALRLSQPAITQRISKIEQALGFHVLEPQVRATRLTEAGMRVCSQAKKALTLLEEIFAEQQITDFSLFATGEWAATITGFLIESAFKETQASWNIVRCDEHGLLAKMRDLTRSTTVMGSLHLVNTKRHHEGLKSLVTIEQSLKLFVHQSVDIAALRAAQIKLPLLEVGQEERLVSESDLTKIREIYSGIQTVRACGSTHNALHMASQGAGVFVAPSFFSVEQISLHRLVAVPSPSELSPVYFDFLVDERLPRYAETEKVIRRLQKMSDVE